MAWGVARQYGGRLGNLVGLSVILAGGLGNLVDRWFHDGSVVDFVSLGVGELRTGIFNLADIAIIAGLLLVVARRSAERDPP